MTDPAKTGGCSTKLNELRSKYVVPNGTKEEQIEALVKLGNEIWDELYKIYGVKPVFIGR